MNVVPTNPLMPETPSAEPRAPQRTSTSVWHGVTLTDEFAWLKAANWQTVMRDPSVLDPDIRSYLEAENDYATLAMADTEGLQATLLAEMKGRIKEDDSSVPTPISFTTMRAASIRNSVASHAAAGRIRCCSTATFWRVANRSFISAMHGIHLITS